jgi:GNAT superfamily N-acetyltransferase
MPTLYNIRNATIDDFEKVHQLLMEFSIFQGTPGKVTTSPEQMKRDARWFSCIVAEDNGVICGFATYFFAYYSWSGRALYLDDLYVQEASRGKGIGKALLQQVIAIAREENCLKVRWQVSNWNKNAIAFYQSIGAVLDEAELNCDFVL